MLDPLSDDNDGNCTTKTLGLWLEHEEDVKIGELVATAACGFSLESRRCRRGGGDPGPFKA